MELNRENELGLDGLSRSLVKESVWDTILSWEPLFIMKNSYISRSVKNIGYHLVKVKSKKM